MSLDNERQWPPTRVVVSAYIKEKCLRPDREKEERFRDLEAAFGMAVFEQ